MEWTLAAAIGAVSAGILYGAFRLPFLSLVGFAAALASLWLAREEHALAARFGSGPAAVQLADLQEGEAYLELQGCVPVWERTLWIEEDYVSFSRAYVPVLPAGSPAATELLEARAVYRKEKGVDTAPLPASRVPGMAGVAVLVLSRRHRSEFRMRNWMNDESAVSFLGTAERRVAELEPEDAARIREAFPGCETALVFEERTSVPGSRRRAAALLGYGALMIVAVAGVLWWRRRRSA